MSDELRIWKIVVVGAPRTKKTSNQTILRMHKNAVVSWVWAIANKYTLDPAGLIRAILSKVKVLPNPKWTEWSKNSILKVPGWDPRVYPIESQVSIEAAFYRERADGDAVGYYQGLADLLEKRFILKNDGQIKHWDGTRMLKDKDYPRVEVIIHELVRVDKQLDMLEGQR